mgnify:CR=1 FL=1
MTSIRRAVASDLEQIVALLEEFPEDPQIPNVNWQDARKAFPELLEGEKGLVLVAEQDGVVAGMVALAYSYVLRFGGEYALIEDFIVGEKFRGRGIGGPLLKAALDEAARRGCREVQVNGASDVGFPVYVRNGFHEAGTHLKVWL